MEEYYFGNSDAETVLIQMVDEHDLSVMESEVSAIRELTGGKDFLMAAVKTDRWNADLSPWPAPPVYGDEPFGNGAAETLRYVLELAGRLERSAEAGDPAGRLPHPAGLASAGEDGHSQRRRFYLGGYSMAGLFALWAAYRTDRFEGVAAASPSVWFPDFPNYCSKNEIHTKSVYLSLGNKEEKTRNKAMARVGDSIRNIYAILEERHVGSILEWNPGNHFREPDLRTAKGFAWLLNRN